MFDVLKRWFGAPRRPQVEPAFRPQVESLEERAVPSVSTWQGTTNNWGTATNWTNGVPGAGDSAIFNGTSGTDVILTTCESVVNLDMEPGYTGIIYAHGYTLSVSGIGTLHGGTLEAADNMGGGHNDGTIDFGSGSFVNWTATDFNDGDGGFGSVNFDGTTTIPSTAATSLNMQSQLVVASSFCWFTPGGGGTGTLNENGTGMIVVTGTGSMTVDSGRAVGAPTAKIANPGLTTTIHSGGSLSLDGIARFDTGDVWIQGTAFLAAGTFLNSSDGITVDGSAACIQAKAGSAISTSDLLSHMCSLILKNGGVLDCCNYSATETVVNVFGNLNMLDSGCYVVVGDGSVTGTGSGYTANLDVSGDFDTGAGAGIGVTAKTGHLDLYDAGWTTVGVVGGADGGGGGGGGMTTVYENSQLNVGGDQDTSGAGAAIEQYYRGVAPAANRNFGADFVGGTLAAGSWPIINPPPGFTGAWSGNTFYFTY